MNEDRHLELMELRRRIELELAAVSRWIAEIESEINDAKNFARPQREIE